MPLMSPNIQALMREAGLEKVKEEGEEKISLQEELNEAGLDLRTVLQNLSSMANNSGNEALRMKANETALKMHGALKESATAQGPQMPSFVLNIINGAETSEIPSGVNPIFLPRQLHNQLKEKSSN